MFESLRLKRPLAFVDVESTGVNPQTDRIIEVGVYRVSQDDKPVSVVRRVNPTVPIPAEATKVHGITDADVANCRTFADIARKLARFLEGCDLAGYGIKRFDLPILAAEFRRAGVHFALTGRSVVDVLQIFHQREKRDLQAAYTFYVGGKFDDAHRADNDVRATALVLDAMLERYRDLPRTVAELHKQFLDADVGGWFRYEAGAVVFAIGKHRGRRLADVVRQQPDYVRWLLTLPLMDDTRAIVETALVGQPAG